MHVDLRILDPRLGSLWPLPAPATPGAAAVDLRAMLDAPLILAAGSTFMMPTGLAIHLNDPGFAAQVLPRSGLGSKNGIILANGTGLIDSDYQGELRVPLWNRSNLDFRVEPGDRIAQMIIVPVVRPTWRVVEAFQPSARAEGGFGHSGAQ
jgi:dUTP pyrophosphatase